MIKPQPIAQPTGSGSSGPIMNPPVAAPHGVLEDLEFKVIEELTTDDPVTPVTTDVKQHVDAAVSVIANAEQGATQQVQQGVQAAQQSVQQVQQTPCWSHIKQCLLACVLICMLVFGILNYVYNIEIAAGIATGGLQPTAAPTVAPTIAPTAPPSTTITPATTPTTTQAPHTQGTSTTAAELLAFARTHITTDVAISLVDSTATARDTEALYLKIGFVLDSYVYNNQILRANELSLPLQQRLEAEDTRARVFAVDLAEELQRALDVLNNEWHPRHPLGDNATAPTGQSDPRNPAGIPNLKVLLSGYMLMRDDDEFSIQYDPQRSGLLDLGATMHFFREFSDDHLIGNSRRSYIPPHSFAVLVTSAPVFDPTRRSPPPIGTYAYSVGISYLCSACAENAVTIVRHDPHTPHGQTGTLLAHELLHTLCVSHDEGSAPSAPSAMTPDAMKQRVELWPKHLQITRRRVEIDHAGQPMTSTMAAITVTNDTGGGVVARPDSLAQLGGQAMEQQPLYNGCDPHKYIMSPMVPAPYASASECTTKMLAGYLESYYFYALKPGQQCMTDYNTTQHFYWPSGHPPPNASPYTSAAEPHESLFFEKLLVFTLMIIYKLG